MKLKELFEILENNTYLYLYDAKGNKIAEGLYGYLINGEIRIPCYIEALDEYMYNKVLEIKAFDLGELRVTIDYEE